MATLGRDVQQPRYSEDTRRSSFSSAVTLDQEYIHSSGASDRKTIVDYKRQMDIIQRTASLVAFVILLIAIIVPWVNVRSAVFDALRKLTEERITSTTDAAGSIMSNYHSQLKENVRVVAALQPYFFCKEDSLTSLFKLVTALQRHEEYPYWTVTVGQRNTNRCQFVFDGSSDNFTFLFTFKNAQNVFETRAYPGTDLDTNNFDHLEGEPIKTCDSDDLDALLEAHNYETEPFMSYTMQLEPDFESRTVVTVVKPIQNDEGEFEAFAALSYSSMLVGDLIGKLPVLEDGNILIINPEGRAIYEQASGVLKPKKESDGLYHYPTLSRVNASLWPPVQEALATRPANTAVEVVIDNVKYIVSYYLGSDEFANHTIFGVVEESAIYEKSMREITLRVIGQFICVCLIIVLWIAFLRYYSRKTSLRFEKRAHSLAEGMPNEIQEFGSIGEAIYRARRLQLSNPELNKVLDHAVFSLSHPHSRHEVGENAKRHCRDCSFCKHLLREKMARKSEKDVDTKTFCLWKDATADLVSSKPVKFSYFDHKQDSARWLVRDFMRIVLDHKLLVPQFDPDAMLQFIFAFANQYCINNVQASLEMNAAHLLLTKYFGGWAQEPICLLAMYVVILMKYADVSAMAKSSEHISERLEIFTDEGNRADLKCELMLSIMGKYILSVDLMSQDPVIQKFCDTVYELLPSARMASMLKILGNFRIATESSEFSTVESMDDLILFLSSIISFAGIAPYWMLDDISAVDDILDCDGSTSDDEHCLLMNYHKTVETEIVALWIKVLSNFTNVTEIQNNCTLLTEHFQDLCQDRSTLTNTNTDVEISITACEQADDEASSENPIQKAPEDVCDVVIDTQ